MNKDVTVRILKGMLEVVVLDLISEKPMHGYSVIMAVRKTYGVYFGPSTIYPLLNSLERRGLIEGEWTLNANKPRRIYRLTDKGKAFLSEGEKSIKLIVQPLLSVRQA